MLSKTNKGNLRSKGNPKSTGNLEQERLFEDIWEVKVNGRHQGYFKTYEEAVEFREKIETGNTIGQLNHII